MISINSVDSTLPACFMKKHIWEAENSFYSLFVLAKKISFIFTFLAYWLLLYDFLDVLNERITWKKIINPTQLMEREAIVIEIPVE